MRTRLAGILCALMIPASAQSAEAGVRATQRTAAEILRLVDGRLWVCALRYDSCRIVDRWAIPMKGSTGTIRAGAGTWRCRLVERPGLIDGSVVMEATFILSEGMVDAAGVAVGIDFTGWSTENYVMIPAFAYNGNRYRALSGGYMPVYPADMYYNKSSPLTFSDNPRLALQPDDTSRIELSTSSASTPALTFFSPSKKRGFVLLTEQRTRLGNSGMEIEEHAHGREALFSVTAPVVRERIPGFGGFFKSDDTAPNWKTGDSVTLRISITSFSAKDIPSFLLQFMDLRKSLSGENRPRTLTPMSAIFDFTAFQTDHAHWDDVYGCYVPEKPWDGFGLTRVLQIGWVGGLMNTYPMFFLGDSIHCARAGKTLDFAVKSMQGPSGYFYGIFGSGSVQTELKRDLPQALVATHPQVKVAMVRKNADVLLWLMKQLMLLKARGKDSLITPAWERAARDLAHAFMKTWETNGELGQYVDPRTGEIVVFNSTAAAIVPAGLVLAGKYFNEPYLLKTAAEVARFTYARDIVSRGFTCGHSGDISQDADAESAFGFVESLMALYWATHDRAWLENARVVAALGATWTLSYDFQFPPSSDLARLGVHAAGAVWASAQNKHAAPGICTSSGDYLFKLYRATGERRFADLLRDIQHAHAEVVETPGRPTISAGSGKGWWEDPRTNYYGCSMERIQVTDSEGKDATGMLPRNTSNGWTELNGLLMAMEIPGIYLQPDRGEMYVFDHVEARVLEHDRESAVLEIRNPTRFDATVSILAERSGTAGTVPLGYTDFLRWQKVSVRAGETTTVRSPVQRAPR